MAKSKETKKDSSKDSNFQYIVRVENTDLDGNKNLLLGLTKIKGIGVNFSRIVCRLANIDAGKKVGYLEKKEVEKIQDVIKNPDKYNFPKYLLNRRNDFGTGTDKHVLGPKVKFTMDQDIKRLKKIRAYRGLRHMFNLPVRGQRIGSNHRRTKILKKRRSKK